MAKKIIVTYKSTLDLANVGSHTNHQNKIDSMLQGIENAITFEEIKKARHKLARFLKKYKGSYKTSYFEKLRHANKIAEQRLIARNLKTQLNDTSKIYQTSLENRSDDTDDFKRRQHVLRIYLQTMLFGLSGTPFVPNTHFDYNQLTVAQAAAMNLRLHIQFDSQEALNAYQDYLVGGNFRKQIEYLGSTMALKRNKLVYPRTSTHTLKFSDSDNQSITEIKSQLAGIVGWFKMAWHFLTNGFFDRNRPTGNKGINLRFRGKGNLNFLGRRIGAVDGRDGTLLNNVIINEKKKLFVLSLSIEDCQPGKKNQFGKVHSYLGDASIFSATGFTKKAPKKLYYFDIMLLVLKNPRNILNALLSFKNPINFIIENYNEKKLALLQEWQALDIIPPEKRSGFRISNKITLMDIKKMQDSAFRMEMLNQKIQDNIIKVKSDIDLDSEDSNQETNIIQQQPQMAQRLGDNPHALYFEPRQSEVNSPVLEQQIRYPTTMTPGKRS